MDFWLYELLMTSLLVIRHLDDITSDSDVTSGDVISGHKRLFGQFLLSFFLSFFLSYLLFVLLSSSVCLSVCHSMTSLPVIRHLDGVTFGSDVTSGDLISGI